MTRKNMLVLVGSALDAAAAGTLVGETIDKTWIVRKKSIFSVGLSADESRSKIWNKYVVVCDSVAQLRLMFPFLRYAGKSRHIRIVITETDRHEQFAVPASFSAFLQGSITIKHRTGNRKGVLVSYSGATQDIYSLVTAVNAVSNQSAPSLPAGGLRVGVTAMETAAWAAGDTWSAGIDQTVLALKADDIYPVDVIVGTTEKRPDDPYFPAVVESRGIQRNDEVYSWASILGSGGTSLTEQLCSMPFSSILPPVDVRVISPRGFLPYPCKGIARLQRRGDRIEILEGARIVSVVDPLVGFTENTIAVLRPYEVLEFDQLVPTGPVEAARLLSQLSVAGVPTRTGLLHPIVRHLLGREIVHWLENLDLQSRLERESWSISVRRAAMERFGGPQYWQRVPATRGLTISENESVSALLTTKRPEQISFALSQLERQSWPNMEVILGLHGVEADNPLVKRAVARFDRPIQIVEIPGDIVFGSALNRVSQAASGTVITKVDDDDLYSENHITDLMHARSHSAATLVGCQVEFVYLEFLDVTSRREPMGERFHNHVAGGSMTLRKDDLLSLGGWRPVRRAVDRCLLQAVATKGGSVYRTHGQGYVLQRRSGGSTAGHTWNPEESHLIHKEFDQFRGFVLPPQISPSAGVRGGAREDRFSSSFEALRVASTSEGGLSDAVEEQPVRPVGSHNALFFEYKDKNEADFDVSGLSQHRAPFGRGRMDALFDNKQSDVLVVSLHGALERDKYTTPRFERYRSIQESDYSALYLADPALNLADDLMLGWYVGYDDCDSVRALAEWIKMAAKASGASRVVLAGSSGGGYAALQMAPHIDGSTALVFQPQTVISQYYKTHVDKFRRLCFPDLGEAWEQRLGHRVSAIAAQSRVSNSSVRYVQNRNDKSHYERHFKPFVKSLNVDVKDTAGRVTVRLYDGPEGHKVPSKELFMEELVATVARMKSTVRTP